MAPKARSASGPLRVVLQTATAALGFYLLHVWMAYVLRRWAVDLPPGIGPATVPLWALVSPRMPGLWLLPALVAFTLFIRAVPLLSSRSLHPGIVAALLPGCFVVLSSATILVRGGNTLSANLEMLQSPFAYGHYWRDGDLQNARRTVSRDDSPTRGPRRPNDVRGTTPAQFLRDYPSYMPWQTVHNTVHPPGGPLLFWAARRTLGPSPAVPAVLRFLFVGGCAIPLYLLARRWQGHAAAFYAAAIWLLSPAVLLQGGTSMEGTYSLPIVACFWAFGIGLAGCGADARFGRVLRWGGLAGLFLGIASLMTFSVALTAVLLAATAALSWLTSGRRSAPLVLMAATAATCIAVLGLMYLVTGFDWVASLRHAIDHDRELMFWKKTATWPYRLMVGLGNLSAFLIGVGVASFCWWERALLQQAGPFATVRFGRRESDVEPSTAGHDPYGIALPLILLVFSFGGFYSLETERIWLFLTPLVALPAGAALSRASASQPRVWYATAALLVVQILVGQHLLQVGGAENWGFPYSASPP